MSIDAICLRLHFLLLLVFLTCLGDFAIGVRASPNLLPRQVSRPSPPSLFRAFYGKLWGEMELQPTLNQINLSHGRAASSPPRPKRARFIFVFFFVFFFF
jgi:hypothetical protein